MKATNRTLCIRLGLLAASLIPGLSAGCESLQKRAEVAQRKNAQKAESSPGEIQAETPAGYSRSARRSGGWSSEAREIESHMGAF